MRTVQLVEKYFFTQLWQFIIINKKKLRNMPFYIRKNNYSPKIENRKLYLGIFLVENFFLPHCTALAGRHFFLLKKRPHMNFDTPIKNYSRNIEKFHCYVHRFANMVQSKTFLPTE
jgi:hypothetical protein